MKIILKTILPLLIAVVFVFLPFFANPNLLLNRNNDLTEFFWPLFYFVKQNILTNHQIPSVNTMWFAGTGSLLGDPQNPVWYLPNIIFLFFEVNVGIFVSLFLHTFFGSLGMYLVARKVPGFKEKTSIILGILYIFSPIYFSFLEAGHWGLIISWNWIPYLIYSAYGLTKNASWKFIVLFAISAGAIFFNHEVTAAISTVPVLIFWLYKRSFLYPFCAVLLTLAIISPALYFQEKWLPTTTRQILLAKPETFPIWRGKRDFVKTLFSFNPETEKAVTLGTIPGLLAFVGFLQLKIKYKLSISLAVLFIVLVVLNNVSPIFPFLLKINLFVLMRVAIRVWPIAFLICLLLIGLAIEKNRTGRFVFGFLAILESLIISYSYLNKPTTIRENIPDGIYQVLESDKSFFRIFCLTRCIPQKEAAIRNLHLVEGYGTLQTLDYYWGIQTSSNARWDKYSLSIPPFDVYLYQSFQPNAKTLAEKYQTKYVISKYKLDDKSFKPLNKFGLYYLYLNESFSRNNQNLKSSST